MKVDSPSGLKSLADTAPAGDIAQYIIGEQKFDFQPDSQTLFIRILQIYRDQQVAGAIPIKDWDDGIPAAWSSYYISGNRQQVNGENDNSNWASLNSGLNLGAWRPVIKHLQQFLDGWDAISTTLSGDIKFLAKPA